MKKTYETPSVEKVAFQYRDQVVVASGSYSCSQTWYYQQKDGCRHEVNVQDSGF